MKTWIKIIIIALGLIAICVAAYIAIMHIDDILLHLINIMGIE